MIPGGEPAFNLASARAAAESGALESWVHAYLNGPGRNAAFSEGLALQPRYWRGPVDASLAKLERTCGPEPDLPFRVSSESWNSRIAALRSSFTGVEDHAPLIVQYERGRLRIRDGNHRHAAMVSLSIESCPVILWYASLEEYRHHEARAFTL